MTAPKALRTVLLLLVALSLLVMGFLNVMNSDRDISLGPSTPMDPLLPRSPSDNDGKLTFSVAGIMNGLRNEQVGMPYRIAASRGRFYVADAFAINGILKAYNAQGVHQVSFGALAVDDLSFVVDLTMDEQGNLVVLDSTPAIHIFAAGGQHVKRIDIVSAHNDPKLAWAKAILARNSEYYVLCLGSMVRINSSGQVLDIYPRRTDSYELATAPSEYYLGPSGLAGSQEGIWISDSVNGRLVLLNWQGVFLREIMLPVSETGEQPYPTSIEVDRDGTLYVIDAARLNVMGVSGAGQILWQEDLSLDYPEGHPEEVYDIALLGQGLLIVSDSLTRRVELWEVGVEGVQSRRELLGSASTFLFPSQAAVHGEDIYFLSGDGGMSGSFTHAVYKGNLSDRASLLTASWNGEPFNSPGGLTIYGEHLYVLDGNRVMVFDLDGMEVALVGENRTDWGGFSTVTLFGEILGPRGIAVSSRGEIYVSDTFAHRIVVFSASGEFLRQISFSSDIFPTALQFAPDNTLVVLNPYEGQVVRVSQSGEVVSTIGSAGSQAGQLGVLSDLGRFDGPQGLGVDEDGSIYVVDTYNARILKFSPEGEYLGFGGQFGSKPGEVYLPAGVFLDKGRGLLYLADTYNHRIQLMILPR